MNNYDILYKVHVATSNEIYLHLKECSDNFTPHLSDRVNIREYSQKIFDKTLTFEAWSNDVLIGLVAAYFNDIKNKTGFISNVSVLKEFMGIGISSRLMNSVIEYARQQNFNELKLEVHCNNFAAINLYEKLGFHCIKKNEDIITMALFTREILK
jgi:ribosomal protein S18 acetylase RimI-like enzyme